jgi:hypothetical protein
MDSSACQFTELRRVIRRFSSVGCPVNISYVMVADKDPALFGATGCTLALLQPTFAQQGRDGSTSPNIGAGVEKIA